MELGTLLMELRFFDDPRSRPELKLCGHSLVKLWYRNLLLPTRERLYLQLQDVVHHLSLAAIALDHELGRQIYGVLNSSN